MKLRLKDIREDLDITQKDDNKLEYAASGGINPVFFQMDLRKRNFF